MKGDGRPLEAIRVPVAGDGAGDGRWQEVPGTVDGVPLVVADPVGLVEAAGADVTDPLGRVAARSAGVTRYLGQLVEEVPLRSVIADAVGRHAPSDARLGVEVGGAVGVDARALRAACREVVSFDLDVAMVRVARAQLAGETVEASVRHEGHRRSPRAVTLAPCDGVTVLVGDALDPPLQAGVADVVVCANLLDSVSEPVNLLGQLDAMLAPGGLLVLASPFSWHDSITAPAWQLGGAPVAAPDGPDSAALLVAMLGGATNVLGHLRHVVLEQRDVPWVLRSDDRTSTTHLVHLLATRKASHREGDHRNDENRP